MQHDSPPGKALEGNRNSVEWLWRAGSVSALVAVAAGAFGAHVLETRIPTRRLAVWETAARYQMYHALAILALAAMGSRLRPIAGGRAGQLFLVGTLLFSGSLYALALSGIGVLGAITPLGGLAWLLGWAVAAWGAGPRSGSG